MTKPNPRKGLKRIGFRSYKVEACGTAYIIRRVNARKWMVRKSDMPDLGWEFFAVLFHSLQEARRWAEDQLWPFPRKPRRRQGARRFKSDPRAVLLAAKLIVAARKKKGGDNGTE